MTDQGRSALTEAGQTFLSALRTMDAIDPTLPSVDWEHGIRAIEAEAVERERARLGIEIEGLDLLHLPDEWGNGWVRRSDVLALLTPDSTGAREP